jgi:mRNA interferase RelE/StbE
LKSQKVPPKFSNQAAKKIKNMTSKDKLLVKTSIIDIPQGDIKPLKGSENSYRLRKGHWRIIFSWINNEQVFVEKIDLRGQVYKGV